MAAPDARDIPAAGCESREDDGRAAGRLRNPDRMLPSAFRRMADGEYILLQK
jgi:hypothetical protein